MTLTLRPTAESQPHPTHPLGTHARILLCSVFGPYARDDEFGSRACNPMELLHNQVTRVQGPFSIRMFHRSWGLLFIAANLDAPCTVLDFPTRERFVEELRNQPYDVIGISSIVANLGKVREMCRLIRQHQPDATIVIGGHLTGLADLPDRVDADHFVRGEGVRWFRQFLGQPCDAPVRHPLSPSSSHWRVMGVPIPSFVDDIPATLIPSVGCPLGCNFCSTSHMFGGKGKSVTFFPTGDELFSLMCQMERSMRVRSFFCMDENFLLDRRRALRLLELMQRHDKAWSLYLFSSANALRMYTMEQLAGLGVLWVWLGLEGEDSQYSKLRAADTRQLVRQLQSHGIHVLGSTIIGLENHTPDNIDAAIDYAVSHETELHQFMLYTPLPGTPFHAEMSTQGALLGPNEFDPADTHGQERFNYRHPHIPPGAETELLLRAFHRDYAVNGPSILRAVRTTLAGYQRYHAHPDARLRRRVQHDSVGLATLSAAALGAALAYFRNNPVINAKLRATLADLQRQFPLRSRLAAILLAPLLLQTTRREAARLAAGQTLEPPTYYDHNPPASSAAQSRSPRRPRPRPTLLRSILPAPASP